MFGKHTASHLCGLSGGGTVDTFENSEHMFGKQMTSRQCGFFSAVGWGHLDLYELDFWGSYRLVCSLCFCLTLTFHIYLLPVVDSGKHQGEEKKHCWLMIPQEITGNVSSHSCKGPSGFQSTVVFALLILLSSAEHNRRSSSSSFSLSSLDLRSSSCSSIFRRLSFS